MRFTYQYYIIRHQIIILKEPCPVKYSPPLPQIAQVYQVYILLEEGSPGIVYVIIYNNVYHVMH